MSVPDPTRAYHAGVLAVALLLATDALAQASTDALYVGDYDDPLAVAIRDAQEAVRRARSVKIDWHRP